MEGFKKEKVSTANLAKICKEELNSIEKSMEVKDEIIKGICERLRLVELNKCDCNEVIYELETENLKLREIIENHEKRIDELEKDNRTNEEREEYNARYVTREEKEREEETRQGKDGGLLINEVCRSYGKERVLMLRRKGLDDERLGEWIRDSVGKVEWKVLKLGDGHKVSEYVEWLVMEDIEDKQRILRRFRERKTNGHVEIDELLTRQESEEKEERDHFDISIL